MYIYTAVDIKVKLFKFKVSLVNKILYKENRVLYVTYWE